MAASDGRAAAVSTRETSPNSSRAVNATDRADDHFDEDEIVKLAVCLAK